MQKLDVQQLGTILNGLAEVFGKSPVSPKGLEFWFETLREFHAEQVFPLLNSWPKQHGKFPVPAEIWKILNERAIDDRENRHRSEKAKRQREYENMKTTAEGERCLRLIYDMLLSNPKPTPLEHWRKVMETSGLSSTSYEYAKSALERLERREKAAA
jgi:hypothetical protein